MVLAVTLFSGAAVLFGMVFWIVYESDDIHPRSPGALLVPKPLRQIEPVAQCSPKRYARSFQDCGGVCGEYSAVSFGTTATLEELRALYPLTPLLAATGHEEGRIMLSNDLPGATESCQRAIIELYDEYAKSSRRRLPAYGGLRLR